MTLYYHGISLISVPMGPNEGPTTDGDGELLRSSSLYVNDLAHLS